MCVTGRRTQILCKISYFSPNMQNYLTLTQLIRGCEKIIITFVAISHTMESTDNRINKNNQGVAGCILKKASDFFQWFYAPVSHTPLLFAIVMLCSASAPIVAIVAGGRYLHFLFYALLSGSFLGWLACLLPKVWMRVSAACIFMTVALVETFHMGLLDKNIDQSTLELILNTNGAEAVGFLVQFFTPGVIIFLIIAVTALVGLALAIARVHIVMPRRAAYPAIPLFCVVCAGAAGMFRMFSVLSCDTYDELVVWESECGNNQELNNGARALMSDPVSKSAYLCKALQLYNRNFRLWSDCQRRLYDSLPQMSAPDDSLKVVLVIGESFIRSHSSLYGYHLPVNPALERELRDSALIVYADAVVPANFTVISLSNILNLNSVSRGEKWWESAYMPMVFRKAGWSVEMYSNQYMPYTSQDLSMELFDPLQLDSVYTRYGMKNFDYDGDFMSSVPVRDIAPEKRTLTVIHLTGQHFPQSLRVPPASRHPFTADDVPADKPWLTPERRAVVADYANSTLYNDSIVADIIDRYREKYAMVVYFSDHGEEMWDSAPNGHRTRQYPDNPEWIHNMHDVPLMFWISPLLRTRCPNLEERLRKCASRPVSIDLIGHTLLGAFAPSSPCYHPEYDVLSTDYKPLPRVSVQGYPYPEKQ